MTVRAMRVNVNMTQKQVAEKLGLTPLTYRKKEQGKVEFKFSELLVLCELFKVDLNDFRNL